ncbi:ATP-binding protein [Streptomyces sp. NPDC059063]|uniref:ATP-binding protein n=1 Tax=unclassified Streptomyces TaxID=2593676 RepID=UPI0036BA450B
MFTQRLTASPRGARLARRLARYHLAEWGIPYDTEPSDAAAQIVAELAANAATHARVTSPEFQLRLVLLEDALLIEVADTYAGGGPPEEVQLPPLEGESGRGLALVAALAGEWGVAGRGPGKTVWARLPLGRT